jgi:hypothetical protein
MFYWKCPICKLTIREGLVEQWHCGKLVHYHNSCLTRHETLEEEANKILEGNGYGKLVLGKKKNGGNGNGSEDAMDRLVFARRKKKRRI